MSNTLLPDLQRLRQELEELGQLRRQIAAEHQQSIAETRLRANQLTSLNQGVQLLLRERYRQLRSEGKPLPALHEVEFRCQSQNGEDGIIHYLFSVVETTNKKAVEICAGDGLECNLANLIINHGWQVLLFDGDEGNITRGKEFYSKCQDTFASPPTLITAWITTDNADSLITDQGFSGEIDLLSLDIDGMDYWIWKAIKSISPRVVVLEFNPVWGPDLAVAVPYDPNFRIGPKRPYYCSASLRAFTKLGREKGYRLIGAQRLGFNAFFMRAGVGEDVFPEISPSACFQQSAALKGWGPHWIPNVVDRPEFGNVVEV